MIEVFRTDVVNEKQAAFLLLHFQLNYSKFRINFDLEDCDNILRIESDTDIIEVEDIIDCMKLFGFTAEVLLDEMDIFQTDRKR